MKNQIAIVMVLQRVLATVMTKILLYIQVLLKLVVMILIRIVTVLISYAINACQQKRRVIAIPNVAQANVILETVANNK